MFIINAVTKLVEPGHPLLFELAAVVKRNELVAWNWPQLELEAFIQQQLAFQLHDYQQRYPHLKCSIIELDAQPIGRLIIHQDASHIHILDIALAPEHQDQGHGTHILRTIMQSAYDTNRSVFLHADIQGKAKTWYEKLGFKSHPVVQYPYVPMEYIPTVIDGAYLKGD
ncbi:GNAT family N-acetyltransferase [Paenibacillus sp. UMB4589-SE434]|uniref:GNAT family N-acetyltransferase n=1 Tax=Paenibacillus sp. UMB4589-SE434 TaxID=3046314 RepID=UPI0025512332|nr:GNAT family N-acetyltransferase [Paenibacillus sp. UMB4589-SE434]MDK8182735.1 GNAT family N-acetyltransferase [Paenibacillus sp. UMB4589-SE434]